MAMHLKWGPAAALSALAMAACAPLHAHAQGTGEGLKWELAIYGWFPAVGGSTAFPSGRGGPSIDIDSDDVIDALNFSFMASIGVKQGKWGLWSDLIYVDVDNSKQASRDFTIGRRQLPAGVDGNLSVDIEAWIWTLAGTYELAATPQYTVDLLAGTRLLDVNQKSSWSINGDISGLQLPGRSGTSTVSGSNWDAIVGVKGIAQLGSGGKWFVPFYLDIGTGESSFTWQANAGIGYRFSWGALVATWRHLDYDMKSGKSVESLDFSGPLIGAAFQW